MCAYWHRPGDSGPSKVMSLVNLVLSSALLGDRERTPCNWRR
jgi:hypothetical protein